MFEFDLIQEIRGSANLKPIISAREKRVNTQTLKRWQQKLSAIGDLEKNL